MRAHYLKHVPFEGLGSIEPWLLNHGYEITCTPFFETNNLPDLTDIDFLIVMGGPMGVYDADSFPWLKKEKQFIKNAIQSGKKVLGICLGAQLIASAMGSKVYPNREKEIGWFPIQGINAPGKDVFQFPSSVTVFHWHGDTFDLPDGAVKLAGSIACENQAFQIGRSVIGLQFHLETTPESAEALVSNCRSELVETLYIQNEQTILSAPFERFETINNLMENILSYLTKA